MSTYPVTCPVCAARQGRVYRDADFPDGDERNQLPHIRMALPRWPAYKTIHPNCRHRLMPYIWTEKSPDEQRDALKHAGDSFEGDPRTERQIAAYEERQTKLRLANRDKRQWERYKAVLGEENMPSFSGFRRMKQAGSEGWAQLREDYLDAQAAMALPKKITGLPDMALPYTLNVELDASAALPSGMHGVLARGVTITAVETQAGVGTSTRLKDVKRLQATYPTYPQDAWEKKSGTVYGNSFHYVVHWYQNGVFTPDEFKIKGVKPN